VHRVAGLILTLALSAGLLTAGLLSAGLLPAGLLPAGLRSIGTSAAPGARTPTWPTAQPTTADTASRSAALVSAEDDRITQARRGSWQQPGRQVTRGTSTLVLTPRAGPYTLADLARLAPRTLVRMPDGSYLLSEHVVVLPGAVLRLSAPGGLRLRLASGPAGFASIISLGGRLELLGQRDAPIQVSSWDAVAEAPDTRTDDGRAYLRAVGGQLTARYLQASDLGFWSGRTGGISLTGSDRPRTGTITIPAPRAGRGAPRRETTLVFQEQVSASISGSTISGSAYGLFVSGATGVTVSDTVVRDSSVAGIVMHRYVSDAHLVGVSAIHNAGNGFTLERATTGVTLDRSVARDNGGSGFVVSGRPLTDGPSPLGASTASYGDNAVTGGQAVDNARNGIEVVGGVHVRIRDNQVSGNDMGIVVSDAASQVVVDDNDVAHSVRHGVAVLDGVTGSRIAHNTVHDSATGIYLRASSAEVEDNRIEDASLHGVSVVGPSGGTALASNLVSGRGVSALDVRRASGEISVSGNTTTGWHDSEPWYAWVVRLLHHPLVVLWTLIALMLVVSAVQAWRDRRRRTTTGDPHPYAHQMAHQQHLPVPLPASALPAARAGDPDEPLVIDLRGGLARGGRT
jgi:nitrous oxidase accessory protein NosD